MPEAYEGSIRRYAIRHTDFIRPNKVESLIIMRCAALFANGICRFKLLLPLARSIGLAGGVGGKYTDCCSDTTIVLRTGLANSDPVVMRLCSLSD